MTTTRVRALRRYRRGLVASTAALALTSALAGCGSSKSGGSAATGSAAGPGSSCTEVDASTTEVKIADFKFEPACVSVAVGTKVTFINTDSTVHTATDPTDDVFDSGRSLEAVLSELTRRCRRNLPSRIRIATVYYKPTRNRSALVPDYYVRATDSWLVFPH